MPERAYTDAELDAAIAELTDPTRLQDAQDIVMRAAPSLQRVLAAAIAEGGWFDAAHEQAVREAAGEAEGEARLRAVKTLLAEETRLGMLVGVAVGFELSRALERTDLCKTNRRTRPTMDVRFLGHAAFELSDGDTTVLIDPFLTGNPKAAASPDEVNPTTILLTHGHGDHVGDTVDIAKRTGAPVLAITELAGELEGEGLEVVNCNLGGSAAFDWGWAKLVPAWHTSTTPKGTVNTPAGLLVNFKDTLVYHLGDTALFSDLQLVGKRRQVDVALMCIGGHFTMDRHDAVDAAEFVGAKTVIPCHYNTFPLIETDAQAFKADVESATSSMVVILEPGDTHTP